MPSPRPTPSAALLLLTFGCAPPAGKGEAGAGDGAGGSADVGSADGATDGSADGAGDGGGTDGSAPADRDRDGYTEDVDCDDFNPDAHPGAAELWNAVDDDCDGRVDADGRYEGEAELDISAVYEARPYRYALRCPGSLTRAGATLSVAVTCTPDPSAELAGTLLRATLTLDGGDDDLSGPTWSGRLELRSDLDWDLPVTAELEFTGFTNPVLELRADTVSLDLTGRFAPALAGG